MSSNGVAIVVDDASVGNSQENMLGADLLGASWGDDRGEAMKILTAAYAKVADGRVENYEAWHKSMAAIVTTLQARFAAAGLTAPPLNWDDLWERVDLLMPSKDPAGHVGLVSALFTNYQERFCEHVRYRMDNDGNVLLEFVGPTGMGKSSCALGLMQWIKPNPEGEVTSRLAFDLPEVPTKLAPLERGDTVLLDEQLATAGEGSRTARDVVANLEDTLRATGRNLFFCSPGGEEHNTTQARLELIAWNRADGWAAFIVWSSGRPKGVIGLPWLGRRAYEEEYKPWKDRNGERTLRAQFQDTGYLVRMALQVFEDKRFVAYMTSATNKPRFKDFETALTFFQAQMMAGSQMKMLASFMHDVCYAWPRVEKHFAEWFGMEPNEGLKRVALVCYQE